MGEKTGITWADHTFNPWIGCTKVSAGCEHCYAERDNNLYKWVDGWGVNAHRKRTSDVNWKKPLKWNKGLICDDCGAWQDQYKLSLDSSTHGYCAFCNQFTTFHRPRVFCASLADVFEDRQELEVWRSELFATMYVCDNLDWLVLTKRPENILEMVPFLWHKQWPSHIWIGVTAENKEMADKRILKLLKIPAAIRFVSVEPMLEQVNLMMGLPVVKSDIARTVYKPVGGPFIDWVICGGESGPAARSMDLQWARDLRDQCKIANVPFFFKQVGGSRRIDGHWGSDKLDGIRYQEFPR